MKAFIKNLVRVLTYILLAAFTTVIVILISFLFFEQTVPQSVLTWATSRLSNDDYLVCADSASFRFSRGIKIRNLRVIDKGHNYGPTNEPARIVMSTSLVDARLDLKRLPWSLSTILRSLTLVDFRYPRLPLGYYIPDSIEFPGRPDFHESDEPLKLDLPHIYPFRVKLVSPEILGVKSPLVDVPFVEVTKNGFQVKGVMIEWADTDVRPPMKLDGGLMMDLQDQVLQGEVHGQARQHHIRPMLEALEIFNSFQFIDAFTQVEKPVDASCKFEIDLRKCDLRLILDLHPQGGYHHGVALKRVDGGIDLRVFVRDTYQNARIVVGPIQGALADGSSVEGTVIYESTNDVSTVQFDVRTMAPLNDVLKIADVMNDGTLDCLQITNCVPHVTINGRLAVLDENAHLNDLDGTLAFREGSLFGINLRDASTKFQVKGTSVVFTNSFARGTHGGSVVGVGGIDVPESKRELASFNVNLKADSLELEDVAGALNYKPQGRHGLVSGNVRLSGPLETNSLSRLSGAGSVAIRDGYLAQLRFFAGLTDYLAKRVPGVSGLVNLSRGSFDYDLKDGILTLANVKVEGDIISVRAEGSYDLVNDNLDFRARVTLTRNDSLLGKLATPITWPFANLAEVLFDFRIQGTLDNPTWSYSRNPIKFLSL